MCMSVAEAIVVRMFYLINKAMFNSLNKSLFVPANVCVFYLTFLHSHAQARIFPNSSVQKKISLSIFFCIHIFIYTITVAYLTSRCLSCRKNNQA